MYSVTELVELKTIVRKEVMRFKRVWIQTLIPPIITTALYFIIFGDVIGSYIPDIKGQRYMDYIVPGLVMMSVINNSFVNVVSSFFSAKFQRSIEEILVSPTPPSIMLLGYISGGIVRGVGVGLLVLVVAEFFTDVRAHDLFSMIFVAVLTATLFAILGFINAMFARKFDDISLVPTFILQPLTYLGGVFYSVHLLPPFWQGISKLNPILYMISAFRYSMLGVADIEINHAVWVIALTTVTAYLIALVLLRRGVGLRQ